MQVAETLAEGLKRELKISIPAADLDGRLKDRLDDLKDKVRINGFRPGKVPVSHLRKVYGKSAMAEIVQELLNETSRNVLEERSERAAMQPKFDMTEDDKKWECEKVFMGEGEESVDGNFWKIAPDDHPGVIMVQNQKDMNIAGPVKVLSQGEYPAEYPGVSVPRSAIRAGAGASGVDLEERGARPFFTGVVRGGMRATGVFFGGRHRRRILRAGAEGEQSLLYLPRSRRRLVSLSPSLSGAPASRIGA